VDLHRGLRLLRKEESMAEQPAHVWYQGGLVPWDEATIHVSEFGWSAVGAVFEGIRAYWNDEQRELFVFRLRDHYERLLRSTKVVRLPLAYDIDQLVDLTLDLLRANEIEEDTYIFPVAYPLEANERKFDPRGLRGELVVTTKPMPSRLGRGVTYHGKVSSWTRIADNTMPPRVKSLANYRNSQLAMYEVKLDGYDVALLLNSQGKLSEAASASIFLVIDNQLVTPDLNSDILESVNRDAVISLARTQLGLEVVERQVDRTELYCADEVFICGTAVEITPILSVDRFPVGSGATGPVTSRLEELLASALHGNNPPTLHWCTPVSRPQVAARGRRRSRQ
jgi:branched-chain amino acid aminotransferase